jgi:tRNA 5-methylaminomethyl-2-thiouridine biosynthesis bifunctional protein
MARLPPPSDAIWRSDALVSQRCDDVFFSRAGGLDETALVFHAGCGLPEGWSGQERFAILELGFGVGLNAVATWELWARTRPAAGVLHFVTTEDRLLAHADAARALAAFPAIARRAERLLDRWPHRVYGPQRLWFSDDRFALTLLVGDAAQSLPRLRGRFDAFFLDGFAPSRNPDMWSDAILREIARLAAPGARAATYSVSGAVRRGLQAAGFEVEKKPGFAGKRERLEARFVGPSQGLPHPILPHSDARYPPRRVAIVGGGIAGAAAAAAFTRRGIEATLIERSDRLASGASGNPAGLVMPRLDRGDTPAARLFRAAHLAALDAYRGGFVDCDVIESARRPQEAEALADLARDPPLPECLLAPHPDGVVHKGAGLVRPAEWTARWSDGAQIHLGAEVTALDRDESGWSLSMADGAHMSADIVVLAVGPALARFAGLPIEKRAGQIEWAQVHVEGAARAAGAYAAPFEGGLVFGATHDPTDADAVEASPDARARNLASLEDLAPAWAAHARASSVASRAAVRAGTPDRLPIAGRARARDVEPGALTRRPVSARRVGRPRSFSRAAARRNDRFGRLWRTAYARRGRARRDPSWPFSPARAQTRAVTRRVRPRRRAPQAPP